MKAAGHRESVWAPSGRVWVPPHYDGGGKSGGASSDAVLSGSPMMVAATLLSLNPSYAPLLAAPAQGLA